MVMFRCSLLDVETISGHRLVGLSLVQDKVEESLDIEVGGGGSAAGELGSNTDLRMFSTLQ